MLLSNETRHCKLKTYTSSRNMVHGGYDVIFGEKREMEGRTATRLHPLLKDIWEKEAPTKGVIAAD